MKLQLVCVCCSQAGLRQLVSWDLDTEWAEFVQFYLRVGGDWAECNQADSREEGVLLQYSNDGGISWGLIAEMYFTDFTKPRWENPNIPFSHICLCLHRHGCDLNLFPLLRFVHYELPLASKTPSTRFRWWQPLHSGEGYDQWAIDDVIILSEREKHIIPMANPTLPQVRDRSEEFNSQLVSDLLRPRWVFVVMESVRLSEIQSNSYKNKEKCVP